MARAANRFESSTCSVLARTRVHVIGAISFPKKKKKNSPSETINRSARYRQKILSTCHLIRSRDYCSQVESGTGRRRMVPQAAGGTGRPRVAAGGLPDGAHGDGDPDARAIRQRPRTRVRRGVHAGVLEARAGGMETVQEMGRQTGER